MKDRVTQEFIDEIHQRADDNFKGRLHQAFVDWYVDAEFGSVDWRFTDDANDGGIDAIVFRPDDLPPVVLIQSKFAEAIGRSQLSPTAYREFNDVVEAFYRGGEDFEDLLARVREDLRSLYRKAFDRLDTLNNWHHEKKAFRLITTSRARASKETNRIPAENFVYAKDVLRLYEHYRKGATPRARPLELSISDKITYVDPRRRATSYLLNAEVADFRKYLNQNDVARLVARNIRYNLGGPVGRAIRKTYEKTPQDFWYVHNGLTIICDDFVEKGGVATLSNPSVVNGAQTLYAISGSPRRQSPARVTTRIIVRGAGGAADPEDDAWLQSVISGVNTQNRVRAHDFRSNEPEQIELQNLFRDHKIFYERKRGEWKEVRNEARYRGFERLSLARLGQILTATSGTDGQGVLLVKRGVEAIFEVRNYRKLFPSKRKMQRRFESVYLAYRLYRVLLLAGFRNQKERRRLRHAFWHTLWLLHRGVSSTPRLLSRSTVRSIRDAFDAFEGRGRVGQRTKSTLRNTRNAVWAAWRRARVVDPELWTPANFFKSKFGNRKVLALAFPRVRAELRAMGEIIAGNQGWN